MSRRRRNPADDPAPADRLPWEQAARDFPSILARVQAGETVLLADGDHVVAQIAPPPRRAERRPRPEFGALRGAGSLPAAFFEPLPEDELIAWEGGEGDRELPGGGAPDSGAPPEGDEHANTE